LLDHFLAFLLLAIIPLRGLWRSRVRKPRAGRRIARYRNTIVVIALLLSILATDWLMAGRSMNDLGIGRPSTIFSLVGLGVAAALLTTLVVIIRRQGRSLADQAETEDADLLPQTRNEIRLFFVLAVMVGCGWEMLYRGYFLFYLEPAIGLSASIALASLAYGAAHGFETWQRFCGSIAAALVFTAGYALTANLWWLMLLHTGLALLPVLTGTVPAAKGEPTDS
jgi:membrane protease YdiL (CAAX protease family)